jgi:hypothetical protein
LLPPSDPNSSKYEYSLSFDTNIYQDHSKEQKTGETDTHMQQNKSHEAKPPARQTIIERRTKMPLSERNPALAQKIEQMRLTIAPIVHICTGKAPPVFPETMLQMFLLTEDQLDIMASYYSQAGTSTSVAATSTDLNSLRHAYPQTMDWSKPFLSTDPTLPDDCKLTDLERLKVKMRMFARFVGMRGAETPSWEVERQVEILRKKIERSVREEAGNRERGKLYWGGSARWS